MLTSSQPHTSSDASLIHRINLGDRAALAELYDRYSPIMLALARRILIDADEAEDLLHQVFVEVMGQADRYDFRRGTVRAWLITKTRSRAIDRLRSRNRNQALTPSLGADVLEHGLELSDQIGVRTGLGQLPEHMRSVVALMYYEGRTASEIAVCLDVPLGTVKSRLSRATARLRGILAEN